MSLIALALAPSLLWLWYFWRQERSTHEGAGPMARAFLWGVLSVIPAVILELVASKPGNGATMLECFLVIGPAEEICKFLATLRAIKNEPDFDEPSDGIVAAAAVALGFAFAENLGYFAGASGGLVVVRTLLSVPAHVLFSVFYGAALGRRRCATGVPAHTLVQALFMASIVHGLFDALLFHASVNPVLYLGIFAFLMWYQWRMYKRIAAACAAEGRALRAQANVVFVDEPGAAGLAVAGDAGFDANGDLAAGLGTAVGVGFGPGAGLVADVGEPASLGARADSPLSDGARAAPAAYPKFQWGSAFGAFGWGFVFFCLTALAWAAMVPESQHNARTAQLGALCIVAMILGGLVSAYRSPGRTVRESAVGLAMMGMLMGLADPIAGGAFAVVLGFLGAFGGWLGEALQDARGARP